MLAVFSLSILAQSLNTLIVRAFYAMSRTWRPFLMNLISSVLIIGLAELFLHLFNTYLPFKYFIQSILRVGNLAGTSILMIGLAFSIGLIVNFFLLWFYFKKDFGVDVPRQSISPTFFQSLTAAFFVGLVAYVFLGIFDKLFDINTFFGILMQGFLSGIAGVLSGVIVLKLLKNQEIKELENVLKAKFWKTKVVAPSQEDL
jgi:peptidoglycan biosynthesis protein MviN/MurJ (putative lipid II flippase)